MVDFGVSLRCNNCCIMCPVLMPPPNPWERSGEEIVQVVRSFNKNESQISITGGEPTIHPNFFFILRFIKKEMPKTKIFLLSNGRMFSYPEFTKRFIATKCDSLAIPLHGSNAKLHDRITRAPGSFKQTVGGVKNLLKHRNKVDIDIRVVIHRMNYKDLPSIARFISKEFKGVKRVVLFPIDIIGNANVNRSRLIVRMTELKPFLERALDILDKNGFEFSLYHLPFCIIDKKYWKNVAGRTVETRRITFEHCNGCIMKEKCPGVWRTYAFRVGTREFHPILGTTKSNIYELAK